MLKKLFFLLNFFGVVCPFCGSTDVNEKAWISYYCNTCKKSWTK